MAEVHLKAYKMKVAAKLVEAMFLELISRALNFGLHSRIHLPLFQYFRSEIVAFKFLIFDFVLVIWN